MQRSKTSVPLLAVLILAAVTACQSGSSSSATTGTSTAAQMPATPPDVPQGAPPCAAPLGQAVTMPQSLQSLVSGCSNGRDEMELTNLSQLVLDIVPAAGTSAELQVTSYDTSTGLLPTLAGYLEVAAQNAVVAGSAPPLDGVLLPVGGTVLAVTDYPPLEVTVGVDIGVSTKSFEAAALTSYVVSNVGDENPDDYYQDIADCVNATYSYWSALQSQPPPSTGTLLLDSLEAAGSCAELRDKVNDYLESRDDQIDLATEARLGGEHAGESDWEAEFSAEEQIARDLIDIR